MDRIQRSLIIGLVALIFIISVYSEKPDTTRILIRHQQYRKLTQAADMIKMVSFFFSPYKIRDLENLQFPYIF